MKLNILHNKKASLSDPIFSGAYILKIVVTIIVCVFVWMAFQSQMLAQIVGSPSETLLTGVMSQLRAAYFSIDYMFPFIVGALLLVSTIFAYKTGSNIVWGMFSIVIWSVALMLSGIFVNVYEAVAAQFPTVVSGMPVMAMIMENMNVLVLIWLAVINLVMFRKNNNEDDQSEIQRRFYGK